MAAGRSGQPGAHALPRNGALRQGRDHALTRRRREVERTVMDLTWRPESAIQVKNVIGSLFDN